MNGHKIAAAFPDADAYFDWQGGLVWMRMKGDPKAQEVRDRLAKTGGHATLVRASQESRKSVPAFHPQEEAVADLSTRIKAQFDPQNILNKGRML